MHPAAAAARLGPGAVGGGLRLGTIFTLSAGYRIHRHTGRITAAVAVLGGRLGSGSGSAAISRLCLLWDGSSPPLRAKRLFSSSPPDPPDRPPSNPKPALSSNPNSGASDHPPPQPPPSIPLPPTSSNVPTDTPVPLPSSQSASSASTPSTSSTSTSSSSSSNPAHGSSSQPSTSTQGPPTSSTANSSDPKPPTTFQKALADQKTTVIMHVSRLIDTLQTRMLGASAALNAMTGYTPIEKIKMENEILERRLHELQSRVRTARSSYKSSNARRAATQREVTALLARKDHWSPADLERFTALYRDDHIIEHEVSATAQELAEVESEEQTVGARLSQGILRRYHEEQVWSDRIRRASTWGTWGLMGVNVLLFLVLQFVAEPWRRKRLVKGVVAEEKTVLDDVRAQLELVRSMLQRSEERDRAKDAGKKEIKEKELQRERERERGLELERARAQAEEESKQQQQQEQEQHQHHHHHQQRQHQKQHQQPHPRQRRTRSNLRFSNLLATLGSAAGISAHFPTVHWSEMISRPVHHVGDILDDLASDRHVDIRMRDVSLIALEGAAAGAALSGGVIALIWAFR